MVGVTGSIQKSGCLNWSLPRRRLTNSGKPMSEVLHYLKFLHQQIGRRMFCWLFLAACAALSEGLGITLFLPLLQGETSGEEDPVRKALGDLGVELGFTEILVLIVSLFCTKSALFIWQEVYIQGLLTRITADLRSGGARKFFEADYQFCLSKGIGYVTNAITLEYARVGSSFERCLHMIVGMAFAFVYLLIPLALDARATLLMIVFGLPFYLLLQRSHGLIRRYSMEATECNALLKSLLIQALNHYKYLKSTLASEPIVKRVTDVSRNLGVVQYRQAAVHALTTNCVEPFTVFLIAALMFYHVRIGGGEVVEILFLVFLLRRAINYWMMVQQDYRKFLNAAGSLRVFSELEAELESSREELHAGAPSPDMQAAIRFDHVSFAYGDGECVLRDLAFEIPARSTVAFVGASGAGKSTLVTLLTGLLRPTEGRVLIGDRDFQTIDLSVLRKSVGNVSQENVVFSDTIWNNITLWDPDATEDKVRRAVDRAHLSDFIERLPDGLQSRLGDHGINVSGGERQRISIARELYKDVDILIFDEATSNLDTKTEQEIQRNIDELRGEKTVILIAHRLSTVRNSDTIYVLEKGEVIERGNYQELCTLGAEFLKMVERQQIAVEEAE